MSPDPMALWLVLQFARIMDFLFNTLGITGTVVLLVLGLYFVTRRSR